MYFATTANGRSETKAVRDTFTEPILMTYIYDRANATTVAAVRFVHKAYHTSRIAAKISLPTTTSESIFEEVSKSSTDQLCCSSSLLDGSYTDTKVGELRDIESYQILSPKWKKSQRKWRSRRKVLSRLTSPAKST